MEEESLRATEGSSLAREAGVWKEEHSTQQQLAPQHSETLDLCSLEFGKYRQVLDVCSRIFMIIDELQLAEQRERKLLRDSYFLQMRCCPGDQMWAHVRKLSSKGDGPRRTLESVKYPQMRDTLPKAQEKGDI